MLLKLYKVKTELEESKRFLNTYGKMPGAKRKKIDEKDVVDTTRNNEMEEGKGKGRKQSIEKIKKRVGILDKKVHKYKQGYKKFQSKVLKNFDDKEQLQDPFQTSKMFI